MTTKSYGIACIRKTKDYEILMIRKKTTYAFSSFLRGKYKNMFEAKCQLEKLTLIEKNLVLYGDFESCYFHVFGKKYDDLQKLDDINNYITFEKKFNDFNKEKLKKILDKSPCGQLIWEFPKGRKAPAENNLASAMREFEEETGITKYEVLFSVPPLHIKFKDDGINYEYIIYLAISAELPKFDVHNLNFEVSEIQWISSAYSNFILKSPMTYAFKTIINLVKKNKILDVKREIEKNN